MPAPRPNLSKIVSQLAAHYGKPKPPITTDPFELILLENVAYLVSDERREQAFKTLRRHAGTKPHEILAASHEDILQATKLGGAARLSLSTLPARPAQPDGCGAPQHQPSGRLGR